MAAFANGIAAAVRHIERHPRSAGRVEDILRRRGATPTSHHAPNSRWVARRYAGSDPEPVLSSTITSSGKSGSGAPTARSPPVTSGRQRRCSPVP